MLLFGVVLLASAVVISVVVGLAVARRRYSKGLGCLFGSERGRKRVGVLSGSTTGLRRMEVIF
ncbi:hypothetical protein MTR67_041099 [Solanum verrucosum]|uniref:Uncharacterized protein n=1 Tax=Solanum verrucosum TaxID=315347 RepID=A0AAF0UM11_SOLVR|nr:hypothetical protein MTR67_041099 [Solanum verrucosum]